MPESETPTPQVPALSHDDAANLIGQDAPGLVPTEEEQPSALPAWNSPPPPIAPPRRGESIEQWGFDEAQIETARRAAMPPVKNEDVPMRDIVSKAAKPTRWVGLLFAGVLIVAIGFGGMAAWNWWQGRSAAEAAQTTPTPVKRRVPKPAATTASVLASRVSAPSPRTIAARARALPSWARAMRASNAKRRPNPSGLHARRSMSAHSEYKTSS